MAVQSVWVYIGTDNYIRLYHGSASLLAESMEVIQQTASVILSALEPPIQAEDGSIDTASAEEVA